MEVNRGKHQAMTDAEDEYRARFPTYQECAGCSECWPEDEIEDGNCPDCIKARDKGEADLDARKDSMFFT